ncbi:hypothetical protein [Priestia megaterium]|uniref:hypothetical protein n=1 Tax=Priestia megaterium TaxID=1404 RepID=UPI003100FC89
MIISNKIIKDYYKKAMREGDRIYSEGNDKYLEILKEQYAINNARYSHSKPKFTEAQAVTMWYVSRELCRYFKIGVNALRFNSPPEVLLYFAFMQVWNKNYILVNERFGKYEMDVSIRDCNTNIILASDAQGYAVHKDTETQDAKKREELKRQGLVLLQPAGVFLVNNFCDFVEILKETLREVYKESNVHYLKK